MVRFPEREKSRAVLIGTAKYDRLNAIPAVSNNLRAFRTLLTKAEAGGFHDKHCHTIEGPQEPSWLESHVKEVAEQAQDVLLVYLSGHSFIDVNTRKLHIALEHTDPERLHWSAFPLEMLTQSIRISPAVIKVFIFESCYSGRAIAEMAMADLAPLVRDQAEITGTYTLTSSATHEISLAPQGAEHTVFTGALLDVLRDATVGGAAGITMADLFPVLRRRLRSAGYPEPQQSVQSTAAELALVGRAPAGDGVSNTRLILAAPLLHPTAPAPEGRVSGASKADRTAVRDAAVVRMPPGGEALRTDHSVGASELDQLLRDCSSAAEDADLAGQQGEAPAKVVASLGRTLTDMLRIAKPEDAHVLGVRDIRAYWLGCSGRLQEAVQEFEHLVRAREQIHGAEHPVVLATRHNLAYMTGWAGNVSAAVDQFTSLVADRERVLGVRHVSSRFSRDALGHWKGCAGDARGAVDIYRDLWDDWGWDHGPVHHETLGALAKLAYWRGEAGDSQGALSAYDELVDGWISAQGPDSPDAAKYARDRDYWAQRVEHED